MEQDNLSVETQNSSLDEQSGGEFSETGTATAEPTKSWFDGLDSDLKNHPSITKFKDPASLAKSYVNLEKAIGGDKVPVPTEKSSQEEWDMFYNRLGRPSVPENYKLPELDLPEGFPEMPEEALKDFKKEAHAKGLTDRQAGELYKWYMETEKQRFNQMSEERVNQRNNAEKTLRKEWGKAFDGNLDMIKGLIDKYGGQTVRDAFDRTGVGNDPVMAKFLLEMSKNLSEDALGGKGRPYTMSPEEAEGEINKIMGTKEHPYWNKMHPEHKAALDRMKSLAEMAYSA